MLQPPRRLGRRVQWTCALLLLLAPALEAAPPPGYYASVDLHDRASLRQTLHEVIDDHVRIPWEPNAASYAMLEMADQDPGDPARILDVYKNASYAKSDGNRPYEREHTWPSSYGFPPDAGGSATYPSSDGHALFLADASYNRSRGNTLYRTCDSGCDPRPTDRNDSQGGDTAPYPYPGTSNWRRGSGSTGTWETWIGRRGDVARALFYLDVRYDGSDHMDLTDEPDLILTDDVVRIQADGDHTQDPAYMGLLSVLLEWHAADPVDEKERRRNEAIYAIQGNRNPFIDHPEWVPLVFGGEDGGFTSGQFPGYRFRVLIHQTETESVPGSPEAACLPETVCVSGALPGRSELFLRIIGPRPNGYLHVNLVRFTVSRVEVWITQMDTGIERHYDLEAVRRPGTDLTGLVDREAFLP